MQHRRLLARIALGAGMMMALGAQTCMVAPDGGNYYGVPEGSYLRSCQTPRVIYGTTLVAECPDLRGRYVEASLRLPCYGDVANENGRLVCRAEDAGDRPAPDGSYLGSCRSERVLTGNVLVAECRDRRGRLVETSLRLPCRGDIANDDGRLVCTRDDGGYVEAPDGSYRGSCIDERVERGDLLRARCRDRRGGLVETSLRLPCRGDIANDDGRLVCTRDGGGYVEAPAGPYLRSCTNVEVARRDLLTADCRDFRTGRLVPTSLRLPCYGTIVNMDGQLVCRR